MRISFDQGVPLPIRRHLSDHSVDASGELGWDQLKNGDLLAAAEKEGYSLLITTDKNLRYQQNLKGRRIAVLIIGHAQWPALKPYVARIVEAVENSNPGSFIEVDIPLPPKRQWLNP